MHKKQPFDKNLQAKTFEKIERFGDTDVTSEFKTRRKLLKVGLLKVGIQTEIMLKQLFSRQNKEKQNKQQNNVLKRNFIVEK